MSDAHTPGDSLRDLANLLRAFAQARDWEQYHTPKNLAMALAGEAGELLGRPVAGREHYFDWHRTRAYRG